MARVTVGRELDRGNVLYNVAVDRLVCTMMCGIQSSAGSCVCGRRLNGLNGSPPVRCMCVPPHLPRCPMHRGKAWPCAAREATKGVGGACCWPAWLAYCRVWGVSLPLALGHYVFYSIVV